MPKKYKYIFFAILLVSAIVYYLARNYAYVGFFNDDAWYVYTARYFAGIEKVPKDFKFSRPIGYPLMLSPFAKLFPQDRKTVFKVISFLMVLSLPFFIFYLLQDIFDCKDTLLLYIALLALNPNIVRMSGFVLSEVPFLFFTFILILWLKKYYNLTGDNSGNPIFLSLPVAFITAVMFYLRPQGLTLFIAVAFWLLYNKKYKTVLYSTFFYLLFLLPQFTSSSGSAFIGKYAGEIGTKYSFASISELFMGNLKFYVESVYTILVLGFFNVPSALFFYSSQLALIIFLSFTVYLAVRLRSKNIPMYLGFVPLYILLYLTLHLFWVNLSERYMLPVFLFLIYYLLKSVDKTKIVKYLLAGLLMINYVVSNATIIKYSLKKNKSSISYPFETFKWIKDNISEDEYILTNILYRLQINTARSAAGYLDEVNRDKSYYIFNKNDIDYIVYFSAALFQTAAGYNDIVVRNRKFRLYLHDENRYEIVYRNPDEDTVVLKPIMNKDFLKAWELYKEGVAYYNLDNTKEAITEFKEALREYGDFTLVSQELAAIYFSRGKYKKSNKVINAALKKYSKAPRLWALKGRIYAEKNMNKLAGKYFKRALKLAEYMEAKKLTEDIKKSIRKYNLTK